MARTRSTVAAKETLPVTSLPTSYDRHPRSSSQTYLAGEPGWWAYEVGGEVTVSVGKSSKVRCSPAPAPSSGGTGGASGGDRASRSSSGGNPVCPRETPNWQKPITSFFVHNQAARADDEDNAAQAGSSKSKSKRNVIHSDDEEEQTSEQPDTQTNYQPHTQADKPLNKELDETIELGPLTGEDSHKIEEYYCIKNKGTGKKSKKHKKDADNGNISEEDMDQENVNKEDADTKHVDKDNINGPNVDNNKENVNRNNIDIEEIDKNDLGKEKIENKDMQIEVKGNLGIHVADNENVNRENEDKIKTDEKGIEKGDLDIECGTGRDINENDLNIEKIDNKNKKSNVTRNKRHLDELNEDERHSKKVKVD